MSVNMERKPRQTLLAAVALGVLIAAPAAWSDLDSEKAALLEIYNNTGGPSWKDAGNWNTGNSVCIWNGVVCNADQSAVTSLDLANRRLAGVLPDVFDQLPSLTKLDVRDNALTGPVPASLGGLSGLTELELQRNAFTGDIAAIVKPVLDRGGQVALQYNGLYDKAGALDGLLGAFPATQTLDAQVVTVGSIQKTSAQVTWQPVTFLKPGGYQVEFRPVDGGNVITQIVDGKDASNTQVTVHGLQPGIEYDVVVRSFTNPHEDNANRVLSDGQQFDPKRITTEDLDDDGDGIGNKAEGSNLEPPTDTDGDGIPDYQDPDDDNDGIDTADELKEDADGDGKVNYLDDDDDGDGIPTADELPVTKDSDGDGVPDYLDAVDDTQVLGQEGPQSQLGTVITSKGGGSMGLGLLALALAGLLGKRRHARRFAPGMTALAAMLAVGFLPSQSASADESAKASSVSPSVSNAVSTVSDTVREGTFYVGAGAGFTRLEPDTRSSTATVQDKNDFGGKLFVGFDATDFLSVEGFFSKLGNAKISPQGIVGYKSSGIGLVLNPGRKPRGFSPLFKLGIDRIDNTATNVIYHRDQDYVGFAGLGAQFTFGNGYALRGEYEYFAKDAQLLSLSLLKRIGGTPPPLVIREPAPAPQPIVVKTEPAPAPQVLQAPPVQPVLQIPDSDGDGISDVGDKCPNSPPGAQIDEMGCAIFQGTLEGVNFETNSSRLTPHAREILDNVAAALKRFPKLKIEVQAHTDSVGSERYNQWLSERRARSVINYLASRGVSTSRMIPVGYGERSPIASNATEEGRAKNRRVVFVVR